MKFQFDSFYAFAVMNGHGPYVWACYGITAIVLVVLAVTPLIQKKAFIRQQLKWQALQQTSRPGKTSSVE